jgi:hypothetical protein
MPILALLGINPMIAAPEDQPFVEIVDLIEIVYMMIS